MSLYELYDYLGLVLILLAIGRRSHDFFSMKMKEGMGMSHKKGRQKVKTFIALRKRSHNYGAECMKYVRNENVSTHGTIVPLLLGLG